MEIQKTCGVCGDKALGYNFNALTCESCKAFFRRNALRNKTFRCITAGNCVLNPKTRKYCRKCRLDKCFQIGMKKDWILTEEEKILKRRKHRCRDASEKKDADSSSMDCNSTSVTVTTNQEKNNNNIFILPILPMSVDGNENGMTSAERLQSLSKNELISFINERLQLGIDSSANVNIANIEQRPVVSTVNTTKANSVIVFPDNYSSVGKSESFTSPVDTIWRDFTNSDNSSSSSVTSFFSNGNTSTIVNSVAHQSSGSNGIVPDIGSPHGLANSPGMSGKEFSHSTYKNGVGEFSATTTGNSNSKFDWKISPEVYRHAIQLEYTKNPLKKHEERSGVAEQFEKLNQLEQNRLDEIRGHIEPLILAVADNKENKKILTNIEDGFKYFELIIKNLIMTLKNIQSFKNMCQDDQIALLKGGVGEIRGLINIRHFNTAQGQCLVLNPSEQNSILVIKQDYLRKTYGEELYQRFETFLLSFRPDWKNDDSIISLLAMIALFYPDRPNILHREYITLEYLTYCHLLQRYLEVKYRSVCEAKTVYLNLISRLEEMHKLNEECVEGLILKFDSKYIGPLTQEIYDLQNKR